MPLTELPQSIWNGTLGVRAGTYRELACVVVITNVGDMDRVFWSRDLDAIAAWRPEDASDE